MGTRPSSLASAPPQGQGLCICLMRFCSGKAAAKHSALLDAARRASGQATKPQAGAIRTAQKSRETCPRAGAGFWVLLLGGERSPVDVYGGIKDATSRDTGSEHLG